MYCTIVSMVPCFFFPIGFTRPRVKEAQKYAWGSISQTGDVFEKDVSTCKITCIIHVTI